jgi:hypothetical protein
VTHRKSCMMMAAVLVIGCGGAEPVATEPVVVPVYLQGRSAENFQTHMTGAEETPARASKAQGQTIFQLSPDGSELRYKVMVANIENATMAHIHLGVVGQAGPAVLWLYPVAPPAQLIPGPSQGVLGEGVATAANLTGPLAGQSLAALVDAMRAGDAYANVHTSQFPAGEIRGQIE